MKYGLQGVCVCAGSVVEHEVFAKGTWRDITCRSQFILLSLDTEVLN